MTMTGSIGRQGTALAAALLVALLVVRLQLAPEIVLWFHQLPGEILSAIGDLGSLLYHAGASLVTGLVNGIQPVAGMVRL